MYLDKTDVVAEVADLKSVLIVPCRFCPAASQAVRANEPYIEPFRRFLKTAAYERFIETLKGDLENRGIQTSVFRSRLVHQFVLCMWSSKRRKKLSELARQHDAVVVLGCEAAGQTIRDALDSADCRVIQGMRSEGIMSIKPKLRSPCNLWLELESVTQVDWKAERSRNGRRIVPTEADSKSGGGVRPRRHANDAVGQR